MTFLLELENYSDDGDGALQLMFFLKWRGQLFVSFECASNFMLIRVVSVSQRRFYFDFAFVNLLTTLLFFLKFKLEKFLISNEKSYEKVFCVTAKFCLFLNIIILSSTLNPRKPLFLVAITKAIKCLILLHRVTNRKRYILWFITLFSCKLNLHVRIRLSTAERKTQKKLM